MIQSPKRAEMLATLERLKSQVDMALTYIKSDLPEVGIPYGEPSPRHFVIGDFEIQDLREAPMKPEAVMNMYFHGHPAKINRES